MNFICRFALVIFGGVGSHWNPHVVSNNEEIFTSIKNIAQLTENLNFGK